MTNTTLESLRVDFETARTAFADEMVRGVSLESPSAFHTYSADRYLSLEESDGYDEIMPLLKALIQTSRMYVVARDYGLQSAMLYKLSAGNMDPRKPD